MRTGIGYDSHRFADGRKLILGGVEIEHDQGLSGHSDADAVCHAITDALLGAAAIGDIGSFFPPSDPKWKNADSTELLRLANVLVEERGYHIANIDVTVICEQPRVGPYVQPMRLRLAAVLGTHPDCISIKAKTNEGMGWIGRGEGIATIATVLIDTVEG